MNQLTSEIRHLSSVGKGVAAIMCFLLIIAITGMLRNESRLTEMEERKGVTEVAAKDMQFRLSVVK